MCPQHFVVITDAHRSLAQLCFGGRSLMATSRTMRVVVYNQPGDASVLKVEERPVPKRGDGEVLVKQYGTSVNPVDYKMRSSNKEHLPKVRISVEHPSLGMPDLAGFSGESRR